MMMYQKPVTLNLTNSTLPNERLQIKLIDAVGCCTLGGKEIRNCLIVVNDYQRNTTVGYTEIQKILVILTYKIIITEKSIVYTL